MKGEQKGRKEGGGRTVGWVIKRSLLEQNGRQEWRRRAGGKGKHQGKRQGMEQYYMQSRKRSGGLDSVSVGDGVKIGMNG